MGKKAIAATALLVFLCACGSTPEQEKKITEDQVVKYEHKVNVEKESDHSDNSSGEVAGDSGSVQNGTSGSDTTVGGDNYEETGDRVYVAVSKLNLRTGPSTDTEVVVQVKYGDSFIRVAKGTDGWDQLMYEDRIVYAYSEYLTTEKIIGADSGNLSALAADSKKN